VIALNKARFETSLEVAGILESINHYTILFNELEEAEKRWTKEDENKLNLKVYEQIRTKRCLKIEVLHLPNKDGYTYFSSLGKIFNKCTKEGWINWNKIIIKDYAISFLKHMFFRNKFTPQSFSNYLITFARLCQVPQQKIYKIPQKAPKMLEASQKVPTAYAKPRKALESNTYCY
jgi:hypothetical protein